MGMLGRWQRAYLLATFVACCSLPALAQVCQNCCPPGIVQGQPCTTTNSAGTCSGGWVCFADHTARCGGGTPQACAECGPGGFRCGSAPPLGITGLCRPQSPATMESCNACDDNANGALNEGLSGQVCVNGDQCTGLSACSNSGVYACNLTATSSRSCGACGANGSQRCLAGSTFSTCQPPAPGSVEICNGCDDDRDDQTDEGMSGGACVIQGNGCSGVTSCTQGQPSCVFPQTQSIRSCTACGAGGFQVCVGSGTALTSTSACRPVSARPESSGPDVCDQCDDDGDGSPDTFGGVAVWRGCPEVGGCSTQSCQAGTWGLCTAPHVESCNGLDDTCDDLIDEGGACRAPTNCACVPRTCGQLVALGMNPLACGAFPDGCGGILNCGCAASMACGGGGQANLCGCIPTTCAAQGANCGNISNCGGTLNCGTCNSPQTCGGGGEANVCGCTPTTCSAQGKNCGSISNGCGGSLNCGICAGPQTCGGGGQANVCGCSPTTCAAQGRNCGSISNGCGGSLNCGSCTGLQTCGGGGSSNVCGSLNQWDVVAWDNGVWE